MRRFAAVPIVLVALMMSACAPPPVTVTAPGTTVADGDAVEGAAWAIQVFKSRATIQVVDADGGSRFSPTTSLEGGDQTNPDWSPDGSQLAFVMNDGTRDDLWITTALVAGSCSTAKTPATPSTIRHGLPTACRSPYA